MLYKCFISVEKSSVLFTLPLNFVSKFRLENYDQVQPQNNRCSKDTSSRRIVGNKTKIPNSYNLYWYKNQVNLGLESKDRIFIKPCKGL